LPVSEARPQLLDPGIMLAFNEPQTVAEDALHDSLQAGRCTESA
jgi:hypothetical protein